MPLFLASLLSTCVGLAIYHFGRGQAVLDSFLVTIGTSVYRLNRYGVADELQLLLSQRYAVAVLKQLLLFSAFLSILVAISALPFFFVDLQEYSWVGFLAQLVCGALPACALYVGTRGRSEQQEYPAGKQLLYYLTLGVPTVGRVLGRAERSLLGSYGSPDRAIIVTGLARAGTTALLRRLDQVPQLWSFTYRHMPFPMSSRVWLKLNRARAVARERSHRDGLMVDLDSAEAFDEYFWRVILEEGYYKEGALHSHSVEQGQIDEYEAYVSSHLRSGMTYLSKNNNFVLRAESFLSQRENYVVAMVYRDPILHASSLLRQHVMQCEVQRQTPFVLDYMDMLGHHEFGLHRRDFIFPGTEYEFHDQHDLNYWLERWVDYYRYALQLPRDHLQFISNESLRLTPGVVVNGLLDLIGLEQVVQISDRSESVVAKHPSSHVNLSVELLREAGEVCRELDSLAFDPS